MTTNELRAKYRAIRSRSQAEDDRAFDAAVANYMAKHGLLFMSENFVIAAEKVTFTCRRCSGTGKFITYVENGQPKGPGGDCYRCNGHGLQNDADARRNFGADCAALSRAI